ncbi:hypothetical protein PR048_015173 [Dryococelus australis]|uniref:MADF domain-containing protein n=1 Tax=Dryococelus australis TaxID=614101 RepID=A0ABQ9HGH6_9NEOP|nr:hypothetical protein PR048_015173 [Dryococelus australis]
MFGGLFGCDPPFVGFCPSDRSMFGAARIAVWTSRPTFDANIQLSTGSSAANTVAVAVRDSVYNLHTSELQNGVVQEDQIELMDTYKQKTVIWDLENPDHFNKNRKQDACEDIGAEMIRDVNECKEKRFKCGGRINCSRFWVQKTEDAMPKTFSTTLRALHNL